MTTLGFSRALSGLPVVQFDGKVISFSTQATLKVEWWPQTITLQITEDTGRMMIIIRGDKRGENKFALVHGNLTYIWVEDGICRLSPIPLKLGAPSDCYPSSHTEIIIGQTGTFGEVERRRNKKTAPPTEDRFGVRGNKGC